MKLKRPSISKSSQKLRRDRPGVNTALKLLVVLLMSCGTLTETRAESNRLTLARLHYSGGGDWYNDPSSIPNLLAFLRQQTNIAVADQEARVAPSDAKLFSYPILFMTGHGRIRFSDKDAENLRSHLLHGGFLYADDDYGMDSSFREAMKQVFPDKEWVELPFSHLIYSVLYPFPDGLPKIHEHDPGPPQGLALFEQGRMVVFYSLNTNITDGWADAQVHGDDEEVRLSALKMGANIVVYALIQ